MNLKNGESFSPERRVMKRVALYVRVSTEEQQKHGISVDAQIKALKEYSKANNYSVVKIYNDAGISARKNYKKRPALLEMIADCQKGLIDLILICKLDRFFRSVKDYYAVMDQIGDIPWKAIQEDYETETSAGVFKVNIMLSVAQSEADRTSERIKAVFDYKKAKGEALTGSAPTGYVYKEGKMYKDPQAQEGVKAFFETYLTTFDKKMSIRAAKECGVHISDETARHMLYGDNYHGSIPYFAEKYITKEQHEIILANKPQCTRQNKYSYIFSGLCRCKNCGRRMSATTTVRTRKNGSKYSYGMYVCDYGRRNYECKGSCISEKKLESILLDTLETEMNNYNIKLTLDAPDDKAERISKCKDRLNRLKVLFELGDIEVDEYKDKRIALIQEIDNYKSFECKRPIHLDSNWKEVYKLLDIAHKNAFWKQLIDSIEVPGKKVTRVKINFK